MISTKIYHCNFILRISYGSPKSSTRLQGWDLAIDLLDFRVDPGRPSLWFPSLSDQCLSILYHKLVDQRRHWKECLMFRTLKPPLDTSLKWSHFRVNHKHVCQNHNLNGQAEQENSSFRPTFHTSESGGLFALSAPKGKTELQTLPDSGHFYII